MVSLCLHLLACFALVYLTPVREVVREIVRETRPQARMSGRELERLAEAIEMRAADQIEQNTRELQRLLEQITDVHQNISEEFRYFEKQQRAEAPREALQEMEQALEHMEQATDSIERDAPIEQTDRHQALAEQAQRRAATKLDMTEFDVTEAARKQDRAAEKHREAKDAHDAHREQKITVSQQEQALSTAEEEADKVRRQLEKMKEAGRPEKHVKRKANDLQKRDQRVAEMTEKLEAGVQKKEQMRAEAARKQEEAEAAQQEALQQLRSTVQQHERQLAREATVEAGVLTPPAEARAAEEAETDIGDLDVAQLYERARNSEDEIAKNLKDVRAMDLAMVRDIELEDARDDIDLVRPVRPELHPELLREAVRTANRFEAHKEEVGKALRETTSMVNLAHRMLEMANQSVAKMKFGADVPAGMLQQEQRQDFELIIREMAMEDVSGEFTDMSAMMRAAEQQAAEGEEEQEETGEEEGAAAALPRQDIKDTTGELEEGSSDFRLAMDAEGEGNLPQLTRDVPAIGARKIAEGGVPSKWTYIDSWWTIGPFPNPERVNIDREFPPDSLIDLDATYVGKGGRTIRWRFVQSHKPQVLPANPEQYGIWYAYTEMYSDEARDVWIAVGSDDRGILKINGVPVWISSKRLKGWDIDEAWRRVHLKKGLNKLLFRVENGWLHIGFSLTLRLTPPEGA